MRHTKQVQLLVLRIAALSLVGCTANPQSHSVGGSSYAAAPNNVQLNLTDAPNDQVKAVIVNVNHAELLVSHGGKDGRLIVAENLGPVDLLTLQNGLTLSMATLNLPADTTISQIRLVLNADGNYLVRQEGQPNCVLQTPSQQQTGIKFIINGGITIEKGYSYSIVADFDADKSIVMQGNGGCLLKPVLKLKSASRISQDPAPATGDTPATGGIEEPVAGSGDSTQVSDSSGFEGGTDPATEPPVISPENM